MLRGMDRLLRLQELDLSIDRLRSRQDQLESGEDALRARQAVEEVERALGELRLEMDEVNREATRLEGDIDVLSRKSEAEERRLYDGTVANPKELEALQHEIANLKQRRTRLEDDLLERMEVREDLEGRIRKAEAEVAAARSSLAEVRGAAGVELTDIGEVLRSREEERRSIAPEIDGELLGLYEDLRRQKRGIGAAALVDGVCQGCHQKISAMELARFKHADVPRCEYCRRILVPA
jgi:uncharacterized protein